MGLRGEGALGCLSCLSGQGGGAAISARAAGVCSKALGPELWGEDGKSHGVLGREAKESERAAWGIFRVFNAVEEGPLSEATVDIRRAFTREMAEGAKDVKARSAAMGYRNPDPKDG